jgi:hypothetical protein
MLVAIEENTEEENLEVTKEEQLKAFYGFLDFVKEFENLVNEIEKENIEVDDEKTLEIKMLLCTIFYQALKGYPPPTEFLVNCTGAKEHEVRRAEERMKKKLSSEFFKVREVPASYLGLKLVKNRETERTMLVRSEELKKDNRYEKIAGRPPKLATLPVSTKELDNFLRDFLIILGDEYLFSRPFLDAMKKLFYLSIKWLIILLQFFEKHKALFLDAFLDAFLKTLEISDPESHKQLEAKKQSIKDEISSTIEEGKKELLEIEKNKDKIFSDEEIKKYILYIKEKVKTRYIEIEEDKDGSLSFPCQHCGYKIRVTKGIYEVSCKVCETKYRICWFTPAQITSY